jgi:hypothetical protein
VNSTDMRGNRGSLWADHTVLLFTTWRMGSLIRVKQTNWYLTLYKTTQKLLSE